MLFLLVMTLIAAALGAAATLGMDLGGALFRRMGLTRGVRGDLFGQWLGRLVGREAVPGPVALLVHYLIGAALGAGYWWTAVLLSFAPERLACGLAYGLASCVFAWLGMFPSMGFGPFGLRAPRELRLFRTSLVNHLIYGFCLAFGWAAWNGVLPAGLYR